MKTNDKASVDSSKFMKPLSDALMAKALRVLPFQQEAASQISGMYARKAISLAHADKPCAMALLSGDGDDEKRRICTALAGMFPDDPQIKIIDLGSVSLDAAAKAVKEEKPRTYLFENIQFNSNKIFNFLYLLANGVDTDMKPIPEISESIVFLSIHTDHDEEFKKLSYDFQQRKNSHELIKRMRPELLGRCTHIVVNKTDKTSEDVAARIPDGAVFGSARKGMSAMAVDAMTQYSSYFDYKLVVEDGKSYSEILKNIKKDTAGNAIIYDGYTKVNISSAAAAILLASAAKSE